MLRFRQTPFASLTLMLIFSVCAMPVMAEDSILVPKGVRYGIWTSSGCSRSLEEKAHFSDPIAACRALNRFQTKSGYAFILATPESANWGHARQVLRYLLGNDKTLKCERCLVYVEQCRSGWQLEKLPDGADLANAEKHVTELKKNGQAVAVIYQIKAK